MSTRRPIKVDFGQKLPGNTREGSQAHFRKAATISARAAMLGVIKRYNDVVRTLNVKTPGILLEVLTPIYDKSQVYVPRDTEALANSAKLVAGISKAGKAQADITYGDSDAWYAALVHEFVWLNHASPTKAKYLQTAMEEEVDNILPNAAISYAAILNLT